MDFKLNGLLPGIVAALICLSLSAGTQAQSTPAPASAQNPPPAETPAPAPPAPAAAAPVWSLGTIDFSGFLDGYYSYNANRPSNAAFLPEQLCGLVFSVVGRGGVFQFLAGGDPHDLYGVADNVGGGRSPLGPVGMFNAHRAFG